MSKAVFIVAEPVFLLRKGIVSLINELPNSTVAREVETANRVAELVSHHSSGGLVISIDLLNDISQAELLKLSKRKATLFIIGLGKNQHEINRHKDLCTEIIYTDEPKDVVVKKIKSVLCQIHALSENQPLSSELSEREIEIVRDVALGLSNKEIAEKNFISPHTVITHRKNITRKLGIKTVSGLTIYAIINKIIGMEEVK